jgi:proteic killer suppression protein
MIRLVEISRRAERDLRRVPRHVVVKLMGWVAAVEDQGLEEVRKIPGYHDEPLHGDRGGQRSIRLSRSYRAFYVVSGRSAVGQTVEFVSVEEVNKHVY